MKKLLFGFILGLFATSLIFAQCENDEVEVTITIHTDQYYDEVGWSLYSADGETEYFSINNFSSEQEFYVEDICLPAASNFVLTLIDSYGDGIFLDPDNSTFTIELLGFLVEEGSPNFEYEFEIPFSTPFDNDLALTEIQEQQVSLLPYLLTSTVKNVSLDPIESFDLNYQINGGEIFTQNFSGLSINPYESLEVTHSSSWQAPSPGQYNLNAWVSNVNGSVDLNPGNDLLSTNLDIPVENDLAIVSAKEVFALGSNSVTGRVFNAGSGIVSNFMLSYKLNDGTSIYSLIEDANMLPYTNFDFEHPIPFSISGSGEYELTISISEIDFEADEDISNNNLTVPFKVFSSAPNLIDAMLNCGFEDEEIADGSNDIQNPTDLVFHPDQDRKELWVLNEIGGSGGGGSTQTLTNPGTTQQEENYVIDNSAGHFLDSPTAFDFGPNGNWANSCGGKLLNLPNQTFMGPALWSSDYSIYYSYNPGAGLGSHIDMLHASPQAYGIAHETGNAYWLFDGYYGTLIRYDFAEPHEPGGDDHSDGIIRRISNIPVNQNNTLPSHLALDKSTMQLYVAEGGSDRILRVNLNSLEFVQDLPLLNEPLAEYSEWICSDWEVIVEGGFEEAVGIAIQDDRLLVSDNANGDIIVYDINSSPVNELGRMETGSSGIMGLEVGPAGNVWYVDYNSDEVHKLSPSVSPLEVVSVLSSCSGESITGIDFANTTGGSINIYDAENNLIETLSTATENYILPVNQNSAGSSYFSVSQVSDQGCESSTNNIEYIISQPELLGTTETTIPGSEDIQVYFDIVAGLAPFEININDTGFTALNEQTALFDSEGLYEIIISDANGCTSNPTELIVGEFVGITNGLTSNSDWAVYPNPISNGDVIYIDSMNSNDQTSTLNLYSITGSLMFQKQLNLQSKSSINLPKLAIGTYILELETEGTSSSKNIVVIQ